jgi:hypothetical protein
MLPREGHSNKHFRVRLKSDYCRPQYWPLLGGQRGEGYPLQLVETVLTGATVFADVIVGATRPAKVRDITMARTKVVFMGSPGCI